MNPHLTLGKQSLHLKAVELLSLQLETMKELKNCKERAESKEGFFQNEYKVKALVREFKLQRLNIIYNRLLNRLAA